MGQGRRSFFRDFLILGVSMLMLAAGGLITALQWTGVRDSSFEESLWLRDHSRSTHWPVEVRVWWDLFSSDNNVRLSAVRAAGFLGMGSATRRLIWMLDDPVDWRIPWAAAESLARIQATSALPALERTATSHWFAPVRDISTQARELILAHKDWPTDYPNGEFFRFEWVNMDSEKQPFVPNLARGANEVGAADLANLKYDSTVTGIDEKGEHTSRIRVSPDSALRVGAGLLMGRDGGEWGGELVWRPPSGKEQRLLDENVHAIHESSVGIIAVVGLAHLGSNSGGLDLVTIAADSTGTAKLWRTLPGAPLASGFLPNGDLFIRCVGGASVVVTRKGDFRMAQPDDYPEPPEVAEPHCSGEELHPLPDGALLPVKDDPLFVFATSHIAPFNDRCDVRWNEKNGQWHPTVNYNFGYGDLTVSDDGTHIIRSLEWRKKDASLEAGRAALGNEVVWAESPTERKDKRGAVMTEWTGSRGSTVYSAASESGGLDRKFLTVRSDHK